PDSDRRFRTGDLSVRGAGDPAALAGRRGRLSSARSQGSGRDRTGSASADSRRARPARGDTGRGSASLRALAARRPAPAGDMTNSQTQRTVELPSGLRAAYVLVLTVPAMVAPLPLFWTEGASPTALALYEAAILFLWWRARDRSPVRLSDVLL